MKSIKALMYDAAYCMGSGRLEKQSVRPHAKPGRCVPE